MESPIVFRFEKTQYFVSMEAYSTNHIKLPDGRILQAQGWLESYPPQVAGVVVVDSFDGATPAYYQSDIIKDKVKQMARTAGATEEKAEGSFCFTEAELMEFMQMIVFECQDALTDDNERGVVYKHFGEIMPKY